MQGGEQDRENGKTAKGTCPAPRLGFQALRGAAAGFPSLHSTHRWCDLIVTLNASLWEGINDNVLIC
jgi:hypothetical protein